MTSNPAPADKVSASGDDVPAVSDSPMMIRFIYDTTSFSDILAQLTFVTSTTEPAPERGDEQVTERANDDTNNQKKNDNSARN
ncbi:hypothetical protein Neosp_008185 [[Neocosmospora] mangrovei]